MRIYARSNEEQYSLKRVYTVPMFCYTWIFFLLKKDIAAEKKCRSMVKNVANPEAREAFAGITRDNLAIKYALDHHKML